MAFLSGQIGGDEPPIAAMPRGNRHPCTARRGRTPCARACGPAGVRQGERQACQRVSPNTPRPQERKARDRARQYHLPHTLPRSRSSPGWAETKARFARADRAGRPQGSADDPGSQATENTNTERSANSVIDRLKPPPTHSAVVATPRPSPLRCGGPATPRQGAHHMVIDRLVAHSTTNVPAMTRSRNAHSRRRLAAPRKSKRPNSQATKPSQQPRTISVNVAWAAPR